MKKIVIYLLMLSFISICNIKSEAADFEPAPLGTLAQENSWPDTYQYSIINSYTMTVHQLKDIFQIKSQKIKDEINEAKKQKRQAYPTEKAYKILNFGQETQINDYVATRTKYLNFITRQYQNIFDKLSDQDTVYIITANNDYMYLSTYPSVRKLWFDTLYTSIFSPDYQHLLTYPQNFQNILSDSIDSHAKDLYNVCSKLEDDIFCDYADDLIKIGHNEEIANPELMEMLERMDAAINP
ncbi:MAG: hypothetical protein J6N49_00990 [Alphaproteobacteria bacterium]|nr:hypothetical protein [Alphaproteobacteria bacterium]